MAGIEKYIFKCPVIEKSDMETYYPSAWKDNHSIGSNEGCRIYPSVKTNLRGEKYIEIIFSKANSEQRFVLQRNYKFSDDDEISFIALCNEKSFLVDEETFAAFQKEITEYLSNIPLRAYTTKEAGDYLLRVYFSTYHSGPREILYKANLEYIAKELSRVEGYNVLGHNPEEILGLPLNLIKILNHPELVGRITSASSREETRAVYEAFSGCFGRKNLPGRFQWQYLEEVYNAWEGRLYFDKAMYKRMKECDSSALYSLLIRYAKRAEKLGKYNPCKKIPNVSELRLATKRMELVSRYLGDMEKLNIKLKANNRKFHYEDNNLIIITPTTVIDFIEEATFQDNCLLQYLEAVAVGRTAIAFIRRKSNPFESFVTMEIFEKEIKQIRSRFNQLPAPETFRFIEGFAIREGLKFDPENLIESDIGWHGPREDLDDYLVDFKERYSWPKFSDDGWSGEQLCLWDCFED